MVDLLFYEKLHHRPVVRRVVIGLSTNYVGADRKDTEKPDAYRRTRSEPPPVNYLIKIVHDPLDIGGFKKDTCFSVLEFTEMKHRCSFTPGTILNVRGTLRIIRRKNGYQVASMWKPPSL